MSLIDYKYAHLVMEIKLVHHKLLKYMYLRRNLNRLDLWKLVMLTFDLLLSVLVVVDDDDDDDDFYHYRPG